jgi:hypothetical protein
MIPQPGKDSGTPSPAPSPAPAPIRPALDPCSNLSNASCRNPQSSPPRRMRPPVSPGVRKPVPATVFHSGLPQRTASGPPASQPGQKLQSAQSPAI